jgi:predicted RNase H-like nuclease (RuvC/YqgF family)
MKGEDVERLIGHAGHWSDAAYNRPPDDWLVEEYLKAVPDLTIYKNKDEEMIRNQQALAVEIRERDQQISELRQQVDGMQQELTATDTRFRGFLEKVEPFIESHKRQEKERREMYDILDKLSPGWQEPYLVSRYGKGKPLSPKNRKKLEALQRRLDALPDEELERQRLGRLGS